MSQLQVTGEAKIRDIQGPVVANSGVITALDGAASQYVRGDGTLADFPTSTGGGSSVSYYLNSSVSQGTIGGVAYRELSKEPIIGAGTDIAISANGYVANYLTDANDPDVLSIPGGNFNCEFYFSVNNNSGNPTFYAELYKYDGTTFTLLGTSAGVPESINQGTTIAPYYFAIPVATAALSVTDRLAIRIYVNVSGRTITLHTENGHLCQVVTTLSKGMVSLNNLTDQSQYLATGTSGTNFAIVSSGDTHTFNLPVASATNTGKLSSTDWSTFNGKVPYTGATTNVDLGTYSIGANTFLALGNGTSGGAISFTQTGTLSGISTGVASIGSVTAGQLSFYYGNNLFASILSNTSLTATRTYTLPDLSGTLALLEGSQTFSGAKTFSGLASFTNTSGINLQYGAYINKGNTPLAFSSGTTNIYSDATTNNIVIRDNSSIAKLEFNNSTQTYTFPAATGTLALLSGTQTFTGDTTFSSDLLVNGVRVGRGSGGSNNARFGALSFMVNTTGSYNTAIGTLSLNANTTGSYNTALGNVALGSNTTGSNNTAIGGNALGNITTGSSNTGLGFTAGNAITTGSNNTIIGNYAGTAAMANNIVLADGAGNVRYQWDGTNNVFGNPLSGTSATFSSTIRSNATNGFAVGSIAGYRRIEYGSSAATSFALLTDADGFAGLYAGAATFSSSVTAAALSRIGDVFIGGRSGTYASYTDGVFGDNLHLGATSVGGAVYINTALSRNLIINPVGGNVGINTSTPSSFGNYTNFTIKGGSSGANLDLYNSANTRSANFVLNGTASAYIGTVNDIPFDITQNDVTRIRVASGGFVEIKQPADTASNGFGLRNIAAGNLWSMVNGGDSNLYFSFNAGLRGVINNSTGVYTPLSDKNKKKDFEESKIGLNAILGLKPTLYRMKDEENTEKHLGFIAQEVKDFIPQAFVENGDDDNKFIGLNYNAIVAALVKSVQEQQAQIKELKALILAK